mgnify:CR=1 FL=1
MSTNSTANPEGKYVAIPLQNIQLKNILPLLSCSGNFVRVMLLRTPWLLAQTV